MKEISNYELRIANAGWESGLSTACKNLVILALILNSQFAILNSSAAVPLRWTVETSRATPAQFEAYQGETLTLEADLQSYGKPLALSGIAALYWQTNGMGSAYWEATAAVNSNRLSAVWTPEMDVGVRVYNCFIGQPGTIYHAAFQLRLRPSPGATPNVLPLPTPVIDFARVRVLNPPWGSGGGGVDTNAVEVIANEAVKTNAVTVGLLSSVSNRYTKDETDALLSGKQADIGIVKDADTVVMPEDRSLAVQGQLYVTGSAEIYGSLNAPYITVDNKEVALRSDIPAPVAVIDPLTATTTGKAADALKVKEALAEKRGITDLKNYPETEQVLAERLPVVFNGQTFSNIRVMTDGPFLHDGSKYRVCGDVPEYQDITVAELDAKGRYVDGPGATFGGVVPTVGMQIACGGETGVSDGDTIALASEIPAPYTPPPYLRVYDEVRQCWWRGRMVNGVINWEVE